MNGGSRRGGAFGVKLDVLNKIETSIIKRKKSKLLFFFMLKFAKNY